MRSLIVAGVFCVSPALAGGFTPDRPAFADSPETATAAKLLTEIGLAASKGDFGTTLNAPALLLRYGILDTLELRADAPLVVLLPKNGDPEAGLGGPGLGVKYHLPIEALSVGLVARVGVPVASDGYGADDFEGLLNASFALPSFGPVSISGNLGAGWIDGGSEGVLMSLGSVAANVGLGGLALYGQAFYTWIDGPGTSPGVGVGVGYAVAETLQVDLQFDVGVGAKGPDPLLQLGVAHQF
jgi:hypothetical protein